MRAQDVRFEFGADMRYVGQQHEVPVTFEGDPRVTRDISGIGDRFETAYRTLYGVSPSHVQIEVVTWRLTARGPAIPFQPATNAGGKATAQKRHRTVHAWEDNQQVAVYARADLAVGQKIEGPAIIEERETTTALPPGWTAVIDAYGCIVATKG